MKLYVWSSDPDSALFNAANGFGFGDGDSPAEESLKTALANDPEDGSVLYEVAVTKHSSLA